MDNISTTACVPDFKAPATFPFQRLPMELQLRTLQYILISSAPILNAGARSQEVSVQDERNGRDQINPCMIFTCKLFYKEGLPLLYGYNTFMYSERRTMRMWHPFKCSHPGCKASAKPNSLRFASISGRPPKYRCDRNDALISHASNFHLRLPSTGSWWSLRYCESFLQFVSMFTSLKALQLDFIYQLEVVHEDAMERLRKFWMEKFPFWIKRLVEKFQDPNQSTKALRQIVLTGLAENDLCLYIVKHFARLLAFDGRMGVGWGAKGNRYELVGDGGIIKKRDDLELLWMNAEEAGEWVAKELSAMDST